MIVTNIWKSIEELREQNKWLKQALKDRTNELYKLTQEVQNLRRKSK